MRVSKEKAAENRARILTEAARLFRQRGIAGVGVDELTAAAGMTHGSLYSQFGSKERMAGEALHHALKGSAAKFEGDTTFAEYVAQYLSAGHRDGPGDGCALAALGSEIPRQASTIRRTFTAGLRSMVDRLSTLLKADWHRSREDEALAVAATLVGGVILARAVDDEALSERILAACRATLSPQK